MFGRIRLQVGSIATEKMNDSDQEKRKSDDRILMVVPDANVLIHGKALPDLPWIELNRPSIEVLFVPPVIRELDKLKNQTGRPNKIARQLSSDVRMLLKAQDRQVEICKSAISVTKRVELRAITASKHDALKLDHADQALINYALHLQTDGHDVLLLTDDTICGTTAQEFGLPTLLLPDHWLREPEPDEGSKENAKLKDEIKRLTAAEPNVILAFRDDSGQPLVRLEATIMRWPPLNEGQIDALLSEVQQRCPPATSFDRQQPRTTDPLLDAAAALNRLSIFKAFQLNSVYEPATEEEIKRYKTSAYPEWLASVRTALGSLHDSLEKRTKWPTVLASASNTGTRPATDVLLQIQAQGAFTLLDTEAENGDEEDEEREGQEAHVPENFALPLPPEPPRGKMKTLDPLDLYRQFSRDMHATARVLPVNIPRFAPARPRRSDAFYWREGRHGWVDLMEIECASWRHGQEPVVFRVQVRPKQPPEVSGVIKLSVHASNITTPTTSMLPVRITIVDGSTFEEARGLVELLGRAARKHKLS